MTALASLRPTPLPMEGDFARVRASLAAIGRDPMSRSAMIEALRTIEKTLASPGVCIRDCVTGPLIDALHADVGAISKTLANGLVIQFEYRSKIARELVMSPQAQPDHIWEPQTTRLLLHLSSQARQVVVGGAYMGDHAVLIANQVKRHEGLCHAFEPNAEQAAVLRKNSLLNDLQNLHVFEMALWNQTGKTLVLSGEDAEARCELSSGPSGVGHGDRAGFLTTTIDDFGQQHDIESLDVLMLDIEGGELNALRGAERYLSQTSDRAPRIVFEIHRLYCDWSDGLQDTEIVRFLRSFGYHVFAIRDYHGNLPMGAKPIELLPPEQTVIAGPPHGFNMLAVKQLDLVQDKLFRMCSNVSPKLLPHKDPALHAPLDGWD